MAKKNVNKSHIYPRRTKRFSKDLSEKVRRKAVATKRRDKLRNDIRTPEYISEHSVFRYNNYHSYYDPRTAKISDNLRNYLIASDKLKRELHCEISRYISIIHDRIKENRNLPENAGWELIINNKKIYRDVKSFLKPGFDQKKKILEREYIRKQYSLY